MLTLNRVRELCQELPAAFEDHPFGPDASVMRVRVPTKPDSACKMFALVMPGEPVRLNLKCDPALAEQLRTGYSFIAPGYHMHKKHWNTVTCVPDLNEQLLRELIEDSYDLVVASLPRRDQAAVNFHGLTEGDGK